MSALLEKLLPVLITIAIGWILRKRNIVSVSAVNELKQLIVNVALPCILFLSFSKAALEARYVLIVVFVFAICLSMYGVGFFLKHKLPGMFGSLFTPWFLSGFEFGMIGVGLFPALFGYENLPLIALIGLGHEFFAWFIAIPYVQLQGSDRLSPTQTLGKFFRSPVILGILGGLAVNISGFYSFLQTEFWGRAVLDTMTALSNICVPLILIVVGYSLVVERENAGKIAWHIAAKLLPVLAISTLALSLVHALAGPVDPLFNLAFYAYFILPPSYLVPVFIRDNEAERHFFSQAVVYYTIVSFIGYIILMLI